MHPNHTQKICWLQIFLLITIVGSLKLPLHQGLEFVGFWWRSVIWDCQNKKSQWPWTKCIVCFGWWLCIVLWNSQKTITVSLHQVPNFFQDLIYCNVNTRIEIVGQVINYLHPIISFFVFQIYGKTTHVTKCSKSRSLTKVIELILDIGSFEKKLIFSKGFCIKTD